MDQEGAALSAPDRTAFWRSCRDFGHCFWDRNCRTGGRTNNRRNSWESCGWYSKGRASRLQPRHNGRGWHCWRFSGGRSRNVWSARHWGVWSTLFIIVACWSRCCRRRTRNRLTWWRGTSIRWANNNEEVVVGSSPSAPSKPPRTRGARGGKDKVYKDYRRVFYQGFEQLKAFLAEHLVSRPGRSSFNLHWIDLSEHRRGFKNSWSIGNFSGTVQQSNRSCARPSFSSVKLLSTWVNTGTTERVLDLLNTSVTKLRRSSHGTLTILRNREAIRRRGFLGKTILFKSQSGDVLGRSPKLQVISLQRVLLLAHRTDRHQSGAGLGETYYHPRKRVRVRVRVKRIQQHLCGNHHLGDLHQRFFLCQQK